MQINGILVIIILIMTWVLMGCSCAVKVHEIPDKLYSFFFEPLVNLRKSPNVIASEAAKPARTRGNQTQTSYYKNRNITGDIYDAKQKARLGDVVEGLEVNTYNGTKIVTSDDLRDSVYGYDRT